MFLRCQVSMDPQYAPLLLDAEMAAHQVLYYLCRQRQSPLPTWGQKLMPGGHSAERLISILPATQVSLIQARSISSSTIRSWMKGVLIPAINQHQLQARGDVSMAAKGTLDGQMPRGGDRENISHSTPPMLAIPSDPSPLLWLPLEHRLAGPLPSFSSHYPSVYPPTHTKSSHRKYKILHFPAPNHFPLSVNTRATSW